MVDPADGALPPFKALVRFDPATLRTVGPAFPYLPAWWVKKAPNSHITNPFFRQLYREELVCWARHQSPAAPWSRIPGTAWRYLRIWDWDSGHLTRVQRATGGGLDIVEEWFDARIAPASAQVAAAPSSGHRRRQPEGIEDWYVNEHVPAGYSNRQEDLAAARKRFGRWNQDSLTMREIRDRCAPAAWKKSGPK